MRVNFCIIPMELAVFTLKLWRIDKLLLGSTLASDPTNSAGPGVGKVSPRPPRLQHQQRVLSILFCFVFLGFVFKGILYWSFLWCCSLPRWDFICVKWGLGFVVIAQIWEICYKTISPETVTNENFHSMYFNVKMLVGRSQAKYFLGFLFFSKS